MKVYLTGGRAVTAPEHVVYISPARHMQEIERDSEVPSDWVTEKNEPLDLQVVFRFGVAEVESNLGAYMVKNGFASKTRLVIPDGVRAA